MAGMCPRLVVEGSAVLWELALSLVGEHKDRVTAFGSWVAAVSLFVLAPGEAVVKSEGELKLFREAKLVTLQWVEVPAGKLTQTNEKGRIRLRGEHRDPKTGNYLELDGYLLEVHDRRLVFEGEVVTRVDHIEDGLECTRSGRLEFRRSGKRRFWRMQSMQSPCSVVTDYVDLRLPAKKQPKKRR